MYIFDPLFLGEGACSLLDGLVVVVVCLGVVCSFTSSSTWSYFRISIFIESKPYKRIFTIEGG
jgi:hypothetical protein